MKSLISAFCILFFVSCATSNRIATLPNFSLKFLSNETDQVLVEEINEFAWQSLDQSQKEIVFQNLITVSAKKSNPNYMACYKGEINSSFLISNNLFKLENKMGAGHKSVNLSYIKNSKKDYLKLEYCEQARGVSLDRGAFKKSFNVTSNILKSRSLSSTKEEESEEVEVKNGFECNDRLAAEDSTKFKKLKKWEGKYDFDKAVVKKSDMPWREKSFDISKHDDALEFALMMQKYTYEGFTTDFIAQKNKSRYWCHTPWLNPGHKGREFIHGLTKEFPIEHSPIYPNFVEKVNFFSSPVSWGVAYFNSAACETYEEIFGNPSEEKNPPDWSKSKFNDGYVSFKLLFNSAENSKGEIIIPEVKEGALKWQANTSRTFNAKSSRSVRNMYHIQMDIAVKDSTITGTSEDVANWIMLTYYFDPSYKGLSEYGLSGVASPFDIKNLAASLKKMRPVGIQFGLDPAKSIVFKNSKNNHTLSEEEKTHFPKGATRLNGPADNPQSACLNCHAISGFANLEAPPGVMSDEEYLKMKESSSGFDFNMQVDLAKKYYEETMSALRNAK